MWNKKQSIIKKEIQSNDDVGNFYYYGVNSVFFKKIFGILDPQDDKNFRFLLANYKKTKCESLVSENDMCSGGGRAKSNPRNGNNILLVRFWFSSASNVII